MTRSCVPMSTVEKKLEEKSEPIRRIALVLLPEFALLPFSSAVEPLRAANRILGRQAYEWRIFAAMGQRAEASCGVTFDVEALPPDPGSFDLILVFSGLNAHLFADDTLEGWLRRGARAGSLVGSIGDATFVLARAGLLENRRGVIHWTCLDGFVESYPEIDVRAENYVVDGNILTCSGGTAAFEMMLYLIEQDLGAEAANQVSDYFLYLREQEKGARGPLPLSIRLRISHPRLRQVVEMMEENLEEPLPIRDLAAAVGLSTRQLERLFRSQLDTTAKKHYLDRRLQKARRLLAHSALSITEISLSCGFQQQGHFSRQYRLAFGENPSETRRRGLGSLPR